MGGMGEKSGSTRAGPQPRAAMRILTTAATTWESACAGVWTCRPSPGKVPRLPVRVLLHPQTLNAILPTVGAIPMD